jgi:hypothetical protein
LLVVFSLAPPVSSFLFLLPRLFPSSSCSCFVGFFSSSPVLHLSFWFLLRGLSRPRLFHVLSSSPFFQYTALQSAFFVFFSFLYCRIFFWRLSRLLLALVLFVSFSSSSFLYCTSLLRLLSSSPLSSDFSRLLLLRLSSTVPVFGRRSSSSSPSAFLHCTCLR